MRQITHGQRFFQEHFGAAVDRGLDPRRVRLPGVAAPDHAAGRHRAVPHPEDVVEQDQPVPAPHVLVGGHRRLHACSPTSRRSTATTPCSGPCSSTTRSANFTEQGASHPLADAVRLRQRRRRADPPDAAASTAACATSRACRASRSSRPSEFFDAAMAEYPDAPCWVGELYFETHRGTFTSQARDQGRQPPLRAAAARGRAVVRRRRSAADRGRRLPRRPSSTASGRPCCCTSSTTSSPGSSIGWVHREAEATYAGLVAQLEAIIAGALARLARRHGRGAGGQRRAPRPRRGRGAAGGRRPSGLRGPRRRPGRRGVGGGAGAGAAPWGSAGARRGRGSTTRSPTTPSSGGSPTVGFASTFDEQGLLSSMLDLGAGREVLVAGAAGQPPAAAPRPAHRVRRVGPRRLLPPPGHRPGRARRLRGARRRAARRAGAHHAARSGRRRWCRSSSCGPGAPRIDVRHRGRLARARPRAQGRVPARRPHRPPHPRDPVRPRLARPSTPTPAGTRPASRCAPTAGSTSPSRATAWPCSTTPSTATTPPASVRSTRPAPTTSTTLRLTLLKGAQYPDPHADEGHHSFTYALLPHAGDLRRRRRRRRGLPPQRPPPDGRPPGASCHPVRRERVEPGDGRSARSAAPVVTSGSAAVVVEAVKPADDGSGDLVVRCYESWGGRAPLDLRFGFEPASVTVTDLLEEPNPTIPDGADRGRGRPGHRYPAAVPDRHAARRSVTGR